MMDEFLNLAAILSSPIVATRHVVLSA